MPVPGTNSHRGGTSGAVRELRDMVCVMVRLRSRKVRRTAGVVAREVLERHHEAWIDYSSAFTLRDTTCHEVVKYVFSLIARLFSDQGSVVLCFLCLDCYKK